MLRFDAVIIGAGAAGMMCAIEAGRRGRSVLVIEHARKPGEKIRISGGGRCNFTNLHAGPQNYLSANPHFMKSALKRYTQWDFIDWVDRKGIAWHEKTLGQLFCDGSAQQIIDGLLADMAQAGAVLRTGVSVQEQARSGDGFRLELDTGEIVDCQSLVVASGGKSIPKMGATGFGYDVARSHGLSVTETRPGLVPLTFDPDTLARFKPLAGVAVPVRLTHGRTRFDEAILFTHRGLSGPAVLQISSYWREGDALTANLHPELDWAELLLAEKRTAPKRAVTTVLGDQLPNRLVQLLAELHGIDGKLADQSDKKLRTLAEALAAWSLVPTGSEGYRTAEVTLGGVDTSELDSRTMQARRVPGLYFIGEVVDVTGWLGGYNFQWAWSSGWCAGQFV
jgi:predicted Rossmann fold flavoprotein